jgi:predicted O-methyltransferase YrrM
MSETDKVFSGAIPEFYERYLVPLIFDPYARDLAARVTSAKPKRVLEIAAGTGVVTRALASQLPVTTQIVTTDLNLPMLPAWSMLRTRCAPGHGRFA